MTGPGSWFPRVIIGLISAIVGMHILMALMAPYMTAILALVLLLVIGWLMRKVRKHAEGRWER